MMSNISSRLAGWYLEQRSRMTDWPHSLNSRILFSKLITSYRVISIPPLSARISLMASMALMTTSASTSVSML